MQVDHTGISRIRNALKFRPKGMSISEIAHQLRMNRNSVAKYLEILLIAGEVEVTPHGASRVYTLSQRVPASAMMRFSTDMTVLIGPEGHILQVNEPFLTFFSLSREEVSGKPISGIRDTDLRSLLEGAIPGEGESAGGRLLNARSGGGRAWHSSA